MLKGQLEHRASEHSEDLLHLHFTIPLCDIFFLLSFRKTSCVPIKV